MLGGITMKRMGRILVTGMVLLGLLPVSARGAQLAQGGKSAVLMELSTGTVLYEQEPHQPLAPASVTKVMTMLLIMEAIDNQVMGWEDTVTASENAAAKGGSQIYLKAGETMTVRDMLKAVAVSSANDCACALAEHIAGSEAAFVERMNQKARELGMRDTHFVNCTGLDDGADAAEHRTSAYDIALMSRELLVKHPKIKEFTTIWMDTVRNGTFGLSNTNKLIRFYPGATGLKTGFTVGAGYCLSASAQRDGMELVAVVMGFDTAQNRNAACKNMLDYGFANFAVITPELAHAQPVPVKLGTADSVEATLAGQEGVLVEKAQKSAVTMELTMEETVTAPVARGQQLGTLTVRSGDQVLREIPVVAAQQVDRLTWGRLFLRILRKAAMAQNP